MELLVIWGLFMGFAIFGASQKHRSCFGWGLTGLLFGPFGLLVFLLPARPEQR